MPNDLQCDLSRLVARIEREDAPLAAAGRLDGHAGRAL